MGAAVDEVAKAFVLGGRIRPVGWTLNFGRAFEAEKVRSCDEVGFRARTGARLAGLGTFLGGELRFGSISPNAISSFRFLAFSWLDGKHNRGG